MTTAQREELKNGGVRFSTKEASIVIYRPRPGVVLMIIAGADRGEFGTAPHAELDDDIRKFAPCEMFMDLTGASLAALSVQKSWTEWLSQRRPWLKTVNILVAGKYVHVTVEIAKLFSRTGELIRIYTDASAFDGALDRTATGASALRQNT